MPSSRIVRVVDHVGDTPGWEGEAGPDSAGRNRLPARLPRGVRLGILTVRRRLRRAAATDHVAGVEEELLTFCEGEDNRDVLLRRVLAAGVPAHRIIELSGVDPTALSSASRA
ncbi:DUF6003 family protein [Streptomyces sp. NPDC099050]|uniref:DUF6003 family protein n=1 Tax=Streptomyces sp. NPDC099050 TaxID=3366100 RepID=UPI0038097406